MIPVDAVILGDEASHAIADLEDDPGAASQAIARRIRALKPLLLADCLHGEVVRKGAIPRSLRAKHGVENLYVEDLPGSWRLLYTIVKHEGRRIIVVVEITNHGPYSRWFPGRRG